MGNGGICNACACCVSRDARELNSKPGAAYQKKGSQFDGVDQLNPRTDYLHEIHSDSEWQCGQKDSAPPDFYDIVGRGLEQTSEASRSRPSGSVGKFRMSQQCFIPLAGKVPISVSSSGVACIDLRAYRVTHGPSIGVTPHKECLCDAPSGSLPAAIVEEVAARRFLSSCASELVICLLEERSNAGSIVRHSSDDMSQRSEWWSGSPSLSVVSNHPNSVSQRGSITSICSSTGPVMGARSSILSIETSATGDEMCSLLGNSDADNGVDISHHVKMQRSVGPCLSNANIRFSTDSDLNTEWPCRAQAVAQMNAGEQLSILSTRELELMLNDLRRHMESYDKIDGCMSRTDRSLHELRHHKILREKYCTMQLECDQLGYDLRTSSRDKLERTTE